MSRESEGHAGAVVLAFALGTVVGAAVALLSAPATGEETRRVLNERAREGRQKASESAKQGREFVKRQRETLSTAIDRGREAYQRAREADRDIHAVEEQA